MGGPEKNTIPLAVFPAVRIVILIISGILFSHHFNPSSSVLLLVFTGLLTAWITTEFILRNRMRLASGRMSILVYFLLISGGSALLHTFNETKRTSKAERTSPLELFEWEHITITGEITERGRSAAGREVYIIDVWETAFKDGKLWKEPFTLRLYGSEEDKSELRAGNKAKLAIRLYSFPERRNPHEFDYGNWLHRLGIVGHGEISEVLEVHEKRGAGWEKFRIVIRENIDRSFSEKNAPMAKALLLGYKQDLTHETRTEFSRAGLSHIMAVSGLHVGFLVAPFWFLIPFLWGSEKGKWFGLILLTAVLLFYAGLTGFSASVSRASLMAWLLTYGKLFHKNRNSINLTACAAVILLLINTEQLFDIGFQLSFSAVFIILLLLPGAQKLIPARHRFTKTGGLLTIILVSVVVQLGLFPILTYYFGEFSIVGPAANAMVVPVLSFAVPAGLICALLIPLSPVFFEYATIPVQYTLNWIQDVAAFLGTLSGGYITFNNDTISLFLVWAAGIFFLSAFKVPAIRWKMLILFLVSLNLFLVEISIKKPANKKMEITFLDVGQADAIHLKTPHGKHLLIDTGRWSPMGDSGERVLIPYFEHMGIDKIDAVILSHPHADHIGGMPALLREMKIGKIYQSDYVYDSLLYQQYMKKAREYNVPVKDTFAGEKIEVDPAIRIFVLGPVPRSSHPRNPNDHSVVVKVVYGDTKFLFSGDAETEQERQLTRTYGGFLKSDLYKAGHHGSNTSSTEIFLGYIEPEITVASLAFRNQFGHPGEDAVSRFHRFSDRQKYTSLGGAIRFQSDGNTIRKVNWRD